MKGVLHVKDYKTGDRVRITSGQYKGMIGRLRGVSMSSGKCTVELSGNDASLLDNCYFTSVVEIEPAPDDIVSKPEPKSFDDLEALAAKAKAEAKGQPKPPDAKRPLFSRRKDKDNKSEEVVAVPETPSSDPQNGEGEDGEFFFDDFAEASAEASSFDAFNIEAPKEYNPEDFKPKAFEPIPSASTEPEPIPVSEVPEPAPTVTIPEPTPVVEEQPSSSTPPEQANAPIISNPLPSMEGPQPKAVHQKETESQPMDNQGFVPKFRQEVPKPVEFIPLPCRNCRLKDQRENCSPKEFAECQAAYAFDEYLKEHSVQLFVEQILIPEMKQAGVSELEKKQMMQRLLLEL